ncbi:NAD(P)-binding protein [Choiromyces venosus 120613-1]|uniref:NAD(P)-binding protein n=1 Tax=Choiromyces venosus 120613-1 TaxID=1336337 RepID=A0A3N4JWD7_9PEZI|nr:NAD(P)-binding protein [Choiromyces venosus 120613-1]
MANITSIRFANAGFASLPSAKGLVALFVGATAGIGESAMRTFVSNTVDPTVYFVGRSESAGSKIAADLQALNPSSKIQFLQADTTLLSTVDKITDQITASEKKLNLLFMSPGYATMQSRDESPEGIDRKMAISYYARMRFALNLLPLLSASEPARVISVLSPGREGVLDLKDLGLKAPGSFSLFAVAKYTVTMTSLTFEHLSRQYPNIGWIHATPGFVVTGYSRGLPAPLRILLKVTEPLQKCISTPIGDSGQGFFYLSTQEKYAKGLWLVDWKGGSADSRTEKEKNGWFSSNGAAQWWGDDKVEAVWKHTEEVMASVEK